MLSSICEPLWGSVEGGWFMSEMVQADRSRLIHRKSMNSAFLCMDILLSLRYLYSTKELGVIQIELLM